MSCKVVEMKSRERHCVNTGIWEVGAGWDTKRRYVCVAKLCRALHVLRFSLKLDEE
jgi:hypothetical protein